MSSARLSRVTSTRAFSVMSCDFHACFLRDELVDLSPQVTHLLLVQIRDAGRSLTPQLLQLRAQDLVLLLQETHLLDVTGEAVVQ